MAQRTFQRAAIVAPVRTAVGRFGGGFRDVPAHTLASTVIKATVARSGIAPELIEDVVMGQSYANSEAPCMGRWAALDAGLPVSAAGLQTDRRCGSGLQAIVTAAMMVQTGAAGVVLAGGVESMSGIEHYTTGARWGTRSGAVTMWDRLDRGRERSQPEWRFGKISGMVETAENVARRCGVTRAESDEYAAESHHKAHAAWEAGRFDDEVIPVDVTDRKGNVVTVARDEGIRPDTSVASLSALRAVMPNGVVTAGNASQQNDAAAAVLIVAEDKLEEYGLEPIGFVEGWSAAGCEPAEMGLGPVPALHKLLKSTELSMTDFDLVELNEAFACQVLGVLHQWKWNDRDRLNVNGSGISLGHPIGATGVRMLTTLTHELKRRGGGRGLMTMCVGGGQGMAASITSA
ncbi:acetyl-CoA C-acetyltransferase [Rhodococcus sp. IEGM 1381]|uniref:acetyl-CoA C-acetyltransferase n=1 Tax=Rhodococcus sp. IEGM 1381 TaxID=3047085 RepID=UPI0024B841AD|nr:acetyl-CoA C-acetyltransferase [Rhodococcus sp. IEGM 1381]MDI9894453.1 acetyl-CoA C-acetyltransferase [Rhodococcus sp. IEGM 1381]